MPQNTTISMHMRHSSVTVLIISPSWYQLTSSKQNVVFTDKQHDLSSWGRWETSSISIVHLAAKCYALCSGVLPTMDSANPCFFGFMKSLKNLVICLINGGERKLGSKLLWLPFFLPFFSVFPMKNGKG